MTTDKKRPFFDFFKENAFVITVISLSIYGMGFYYLKCYVEMFSIDVFDLDLRSVDLFFALSRVDYSLVVMTVFFVAMFVVIVFVYYFFDSIEYSKSKSKIKIIAYFLQILNPVFFVAIILYFVFKLVPTEAKVNAFYVMASYPDECIVYKSQDKSGKDVLIKSFGRKIISSNRGVWFLAQTVNGVKVPLVTIFVSAAQLNSLYTPIRILNYSSSHAKEARQKTVS